MRFNHVRLAGIGVGVPHEVWTSAELEDRLAPVYQRLRLPTGRLELMTGIVERRVWSVGTRPSGPSIDTANQLLDGLSFDRSRIGSLIHASVCRDFLEPATASRVHSYLRLPENCWTYDVSNACLGLLNGILQIATLIEGGAIEAGIVVGTENSRPLLEQTIQHLNSDTTLTRQSIKPTLASLTIGSASCAMLLVHERLSPAGARLIGAAVRCHSEHHGLCCSDEDSAGAAMQPLMDTDAERLLHAGVAAGVATMKPFLSATGWSRDEIDVSVCHQVGGRHRSAMLDALGLSEERDIAAFPRLGNTGSVALPTALAHGVAWNQIRAGHRVGLLGIGSGINCIMLGVRCDSVDEPSVSNKYAIPIFGNLLLPKDL